MARPTEYLGTAAFASRYPSPTPNAHRLIYVSGNGCSLSRRDAGHPRHSGAKAYRARQFLRSLRQAIHTLFSHFIHRFCYAAVRDEEQAAAIQGTGMDITDLPWPSLAGISQHRKLQAGDLESLQKERVENTCRILVGHDRERILDTQWIAFWSI